MTRTRLKHRPSRPCGYRLMRERAGWSAARAAKAVKLAESTFLRQERTASFCPWRIVRLAALYGCSIHDLVYEHRVGGWRPA